MALSEFKELISGLAVVTTVLNFLSGMLVCKQYVVNRSTAEASPLPFLTGVLASALWLMYGITKDDSKIILVNIIGITLMTLYSLVFYMYTYKKSTTFKQMVFTMGLVVSSVGYLRFEEDKETLLGRLGTVACLVTLLAIAAPMSKLFYVLKVKSTECLPFPMILMSFFVSSLWFLYGVIEEDNYLILPNIVGAGLSVFQLSLFVVFPRTPPLLPKSVLA
ncbi:sugar transporter SWEET1 [Cydia splendana]|uniref:sugar transporter SWEET1 n=1 Tax=Cydia splendana TaxID=1100963 RepID=UPI00212D4F09